MISRLVLTVSFAALAYLVIDTAHPLGGSPVLDWCVLLGVLAASAAVFHFGPRD